MRRGDAELIGALAQRGQGPQVGIRPAEDEDGGFEDEIDHRLRFRLL